MGSVKAALPPSIAILLEAVAAVGVVAAWDGATTPREGRT